jgi:hypothetical protein
MTHAWCSDPSRDEAVRAAEDNRTEPLPTLGEAIVLAFGFDKASAQRACDEVNSWPDDVQKDCRFVLGNLLEQGVERLQALVESWRWGKGLLAARYPAMFPKSVSASSAADHENKGVRMTKSDRQAADYRAEAIARPFAEAAERSSTVSKTGDGQSGMRVERVTLEVTHYGPESAAGWEWKYHIRPRHIFKSVRVVEEAVGSVDDRAYADKMSCDEERDFANRILDQRDAAIREREELRSEITSVRNRWAVSRCANDVLKDRVAKLEAAAKLAPDANDDGGSNHAAQAASGGGEGEPVADAWGVRMKSGTFKGFLFPSREQANKCAELITDEVVALFEEPPQPRGWLSEKERKWIEYMKDNCVLPYAGMACMEAILARSSPPEVVLDALPTDETGECFSRRDVIKALAAAGVAVKEVGRG